jgi:hypothetical protein
LIDFDEFEPPPTDPVERGKAYAEASVTVLPVEYVSLIFDGEEHTQAGGVMLIGSEQDIVAAEKIARRRTAERN